MTLANHFASRMSFELARKEAPEFSAAAAKALREYPWPGNIRQLKNVVERAIYRSDDAMIHHIDFDPFRSPYPSLEVSAPSTAEGAGSRPLTSPVWKEGEKFEDAIRDFTIKLLVSALEETQFNQRKAAERLGMSYHQFRWVYQKHRDQIDRAREL